MTLNVRPEFNRDLIRAYGGPIELKWVDWTPTIGASGGSVANTSITYAKYLRFGAACHIIGNFSTDTSTTPSYITVTLPFTTENLGSFQGGVGSGFDGSDHMAFANPRDNSTEMRLYKYDFSTWADRIGARFSFNLLYNCVDT
jgi:hypothetical protein